MAEDDPSICDLCGVVAPTASVELNQNVGLVLVRQARSCRGRLCRRCLHRTFWRYSLTTATLGWWGVTSVYYSLRYLTGNLRCLWTHARLAPVPLGAPQAQAVVERTLPALRPHLPWLKEQLARGRSLAGLVQELQEKTALEPRDLMVTLTLLSAGAILE